MSMFIISYAEGRGWKTMDLFVSKILLFRYDAG